MHAITGTRLKDDQRRVGKFLGSMKNFKSVQLDGGDFFFFLNVKIGKFFLLGREGGREDPGSGRDRLISITVNLG